MPRTARACAFCLEHPSSPCFCASGVCCFIAIIHREPVFCFSKTIHGTQTNIPSSQALLPGLMQRVSPSVSLFLPLPCCLSLFLPLRCKQLLLCMNGLETSRGNGSWGLPVFSACAVGIRLGLSRSGSSTQPGQKRFENGCGLCLPDGTSAYWLLLGRHGGAM